MPYKATSKVFIVGTLDGEPLIKQLLEYVKAMPDVQSIFYVIFDSLHNVILSTRDEKALQPSLVRN